jgi:hypothetical protein
MMKKKGYSKGGKLKMVTKNGKKVPFYAADGKGKMAKGGMAKKKKGYAKGGAMKKKGYMGGGMTAMQPEMMQEDPMAMGMYGGGMTKKKKKGYAKGGAMKKKGYARGGKIKKMSKGGFLAPPARPLKGMGRKR